jgi:hypothetical protein
MYTPTQVPTDFVNGRICSIGRHVAHVCTPDQFQTLDGVELRPALPVNCCADKRHHNRYCGENPQRAHSSTAERVLADLQGTAPSTRKAAGDIFCSSESLTRAGILPR